LITRKQVAVNLDLGGTWAVTNTVGNVSINGIVPGEIHGDLMASGVIGDAYYRYNDIEYRWVLFQDWIYSRNFEVSNELLQQQVVSSFESIFFINLLIILNSILFYSMLFCF